VDLDDLWGVILAVKAERKAIRELKVGEKHECPQRIHFREDGDGCEMIVTVVKKTEGSKS
jgi:hypothetical protein